MATLGGSVEKIIINGVAYSTSDMYVTKEVLTGEFFYRKDTPVTSVYSDIALKRAKYVGRSFDPNDETSYSRYTIVPGYVRKELYYNLLLTSEGLLNPAYSLTVHTMTTGNRSIICTEEQREAIIKRIGFVPGIYNTDIYYDPTEMAYLDKAKPYRKFDNTYSKLSIMDVLGKIPAVEETRTPEVRDILKNLLRRNIQMGVESLTYKELEGLKYTWGLELETCRGRLEDDEVIDLNVKAVHDGSLREPDGSNPIGGEYVSGVLIGDSGLAQLHEICRVLQTKCEVDKRCGVHVHVGNLNWNKEDIVYSYILGELIEKELFSTLPKSRRSNSYCRSLDRLLLGYLPSLSATKSTQSYQILIDELYNAIFTLVAGQGGNASIHLNKYMNHPKGSKCGYDKSAQRYCWLNYVTLMFNTKGGENSWTLEFRPMSGTLNYTKIKNWLKLCLAFCSFVENHKALIKNHSKVPVTLDVIISKVYPKTGQKLIEYLNERKQVFEKADESIDYAVDNKISKKSIKEVVCAS